MTQQQENQIPNRRAFDNWKVVGPFPRVISFLLDAVLNASFVWIGIFATGKTPTPSQMIFWWVLSMWAWEGIWITLTGTTPAKRFFGVSIYSPRADGTPTPSQVCLRILTFWLSFFLLLTGLTPILFRRDRRGWHDLISETLTVGKEKEIPSPFAQRVGQTLLLVQSLAVFSTVGAILLSSSTGRMTIVTQNLKETTCEDRDLLLQKTPEVLVALTVSPAWNECFSRMQSAMGAIGDSQLARVAELAAKYFELFSYSPELRPEFYHAEIQAREEDLCRGTHGFEDVCKTARHLASVAAKTEIPEGELSWLKQYEGLVRTLAQENNPVKRVDFLKEAIHSQKDPIVVGALKDRLWAEELALGRRPTQKLPNSYNHAWNQEQLCWIDAFGLDATGACRDTNYRDAVTYFNSLSGDGELEDVQDELSRLELGGFSKDFSALLMAWKAHEAGHPEEIAGFVSHIPWTSPVRKLAGQLSQDQ